jgi:hypothetical protein
MFSEIYIFFVFFQFKNIKYITFMSITIKYLNLDNVQYDMETLAANIETLSLLKIVRKQKLTLEFIKNYILNEDYQVTVEESYIDKHFVLLYQTHIDPNDLKDY